MELCLTNGHVVDSKNGIDETLDIRVKDGVIAEIGKNLPLHNGEREIDCTGFTVIPGICDMHIHMRDPGQIEKEDIITAGEAAAAGGVSAVLFWRYYRIAVKEFGGMTGDLAGWFLQCTELALMAVIAILSRTAG